MKNLNILFALPLAILLFSGCDKMKEKRFSTTIPFDFVVQISDADTVHVDLQGSITSLINQELNKVKDDIKRYELVSMNYKIWEYNGGTPNNFRGTMGFGNANSISPGVIYSYNDIDLKAGNDNASRVDLNLNSQDIARIQQYFMDTNGMRMYFVGDVTSKPVHFIMQVTVNIDAIAEVKK